MQEITSVKNPKIQHIRKLKDRRYRRDCGQFLVEGENLIKDLPDAISVESIFALKDKADEFAYILDRYDCASVYLVDGKVMDAVCNTVHPSGIAAVVNYAPYEGAIDGNAVVLDGVSDPGNMGTIIRTCVACSIKHVVAVDCVDFLSDKVIRSSMGGIFKVNITECERAAVADILKDHHIYALDMGGENLFELGEINVPFALAVGNESRGLSDIVRASSQVVSLPMTGDIESLNAAVSLSVALYEFSCGRLTKTIK